MVCDVDFEGEIVIITRPQTVALMPRQLKQVHYYSEG